MDANDLDRMLSNDRFRSRRHHYVFAHQAVPSLLFTAPARFLPVLFSEAGESFIRDFWAKVGEKTVPMDDRLPADEVSFEIVANEAREKLGLITLPRAERVTEAFFIAVRARLSDDDDGEVSPDLAYYTLEYSAANVVDRKTPPDPPLTSLCGWTAEGNHVNLGDGPAPTREAFLEAVRQQ